MMTKNRTRLTLCISLLCINLAFIWGNSLLPGEISGAFSDFVKDCLNAILELLLGPRPEKPPGGGGLLRKLAHFTEFACLGMSLRWLYGMLREKKTHQLIPPLLTGIAVAAIDETIQIFVPLRGPAIKDVGIDTAGLVLGIVLITLIHKSKTKKSIVMEETT